ncbi:MAG: serine hydrolase domain-containing protein [Planctomycetota bacterium]|jgi:CubicO group peptidase (beta-lactamase class C family)
MTPPDHKTSRPRKRRWLRFTLFALLAVLIGATARYGPAMASVGAGYGAKLLCSGVFVSGRDPEAILTQDLSFLPGIKGEVDRERKTATVTFLFQPVTAVYREGLGSTLAVDGVSVEQLLAQVPPDLTPKTFPEDAPWPLGDGEPETPRPKVDPAAIERALDYAFSEIEGEPQKRTRAALIVYRGHIVGERYAEGLDEKTPLLGWSMTKSVTNALVGRLVQRNQLALDQTRLLPEWGGEGDERGALTLDQLLRMESGLAFEESYFQPRADAVTMLFRSADASALAANKPLAYKPDTHWSYSSGTSNVLCRIMKNTFESDLAAYWSFPRRALFDKLGMRSAVMEVDASGTFVGSSFMYATGRDWARFGLLYLHDGVFAGERILPKGWVEGSGTPTPHSPIGKFGRHFWLNAGEPGAPETRERGQLPADLLLAAGFQGQHVAILPSHDLVCVRLGLSIRESAWDLTPFVKGALEALPSAAAAKTTP